MCYSYPFPPNFSSTNNLAQKLFVVRVEKCSSEILLKIKKIFCAFLTPTTAQGTKIDSIALKKLENRYIITYPEIYGGYWSTNKYASYGVKPKKASKIGESKILYITVNNKELVETIECTKP